MSPLLPFLLVTTGSLSMAQDTKDGFNMYKDLQRGKVDELERLVGDVDFQIDHTEQTWPSVGAKVQLPNSAKRTMNRYKNQMLSKDNDVKIDQGDEIDLEDSENDEDTITATRILIPRTHVMWRGEDIKLKRGAVKWGMRLATTKTDNNRLFRDLIIFSKTGRFLPLSFYKDPNEELSTSKARCKQIYKNIYQCN